MNNNEKKYYTPSIEEFHIGFEYEYLNENNDWIKCSSPEEITKKGYEEQTYGLRVKHLDKEDIESLGFTFKGKSIDLFFEKKGNFNVGSWTSYSMYLQYGLRDNRLKITVFDIETPYVLFQGIIKNKSELIKTLKMIGA